MSVYVFFHKNCHDGLAAAWVLKQQYPDAIFVPTIYQPADWLKYMDKITADDTVFFVDFCPKPEELDALIGKAKHVEVLDHHKTSIDAILFYRDYKNTLIDHCSFKEDKSGAVIAWERFNPGKEAPELLKWIGMIDLWKMQNDEDWAVMQYIRTVLPMGATIEDFDKMVRWFNLEDAKKMGGMVHQRVKKDCDAALKSSYTITLIAPNGQEFEVVGVNALMMQSEIGNHITEKTGKTACVFFINPAKGIAKVSFRGKGSREVATAFGGGGHDNAAACVLPIEDWLKQLKTAKHLYMGSELT
jgi:oligoribonuclease NrnB/cAMP/cGMP phosphodiesterase (DHH superfamily)